MLETKTLMMVMISFIIHAVKEFEWLYLKVDWKHSVGESQSPGGRIKHTHSHT